MKTTWWRTLLAMIISLVFWGAILQSGPTIAMMTGETPQTIALGNFWDTMGILLVIYAYALGGWLICILPLTIWSMTRNWLQHPVATEGVWTLLGVISYAILIVSRAGSARSELMLLAWIPALIGLLAGCAYRRLIRRMEKK